MLHICCAWRWQYESTGGVALGINNAGELSGTAQFRSLDTFTTNQPTSMESSYANMLEDKAPPLISKPLEDATGGGRFRRRRYGVYDITYEAKPVSRCPTNGFEDMRTNSPYVKVFVADTIKLAPAAFVVYVMTTIWQGVTSAIHLYWLSTFLEMLEDDFNNGTLATEIATETYRYVAMYWICCAFVNIAMERMHVLSLEELRKRLRAHFIPPLLESCLKLDLTSSQDMNAIFPVSSSFESMFPGEPFLTQLSHLAIRTFGLISQVLVLLYAVVRRQSPERELLLCLSLAFPVVWWLAPVNGIGSAAYVYWPHNKHFKRMKELFNLAFTPEYRSDLILNGTASFIKTEYQKSAEQLGDVPDTEPYAWSSPLRRSWYWDFLMELTLEYPLALYALTLPARPSLSSIASIALLREVTKSMKLTIVQHAEDMSSLKEIFWQVKKLYNAINCRNEMMQGREAFPRSGKKSNGSGMKLTFQNVSFQYPGRKDDALREISFDILPSQIVLVVGANGSGKSSMIKLMARLFDPSAGTILVDDLPLADYDADQLRAAMAVQSQSPVVYPVSIRENICAGLPPTFDVDDAQVEEAARKGGCSDWISRLSENYETKLVPSFDTTNGWRMGVWGHPTAELLNEYERHAGHKVSISGGEQQRLAASRLFMRLNNGKTRLVVVDEATSALDPIAERNILCELLEPELRKGKTMIFVTHRFRHLAECADHILCMKEGSVIEQGKHVDLLKADGEYAKLYNALTDDVDPPLTPALPSPLSSPLRPSPIAASDSESSCL